MTAAMETPAQIRDRLLARFPDAKIEVVTNPGPAEQHSLLLAGDSAPALALFLRDDPALRLDYCSNVTGVDWPEREIVETITKTVTVAPAAAHPVLPPGAPPPPATLPADLGSAATEPVTRVVEEKVKRVLPAYLEVVYHLYSMALKHGPVIIRLRTANRTDRVTLPSLTPVWRACDFQEREVFDLFGIVFTGHPDLRRILMWDEYKDHPMRKDYVEPDDYEWEPTPHDTVIAKAKAHHPAPAGEPAAAAPEGAAS